jgi:plastocyanin
MRRLKLTLTAIAFILLSANLTFAGSINGTVTVKGLRLPEDVVIFIEKVGENKFEAPKESTVLDQKNLVFIPHVMPILIGTKVDFPNNDNVRHNVLSPSKAKKFNLGTYGSGETRSMVFDNPGVIALLCNVHAEMSAFILAVKNPYFAVTDKEGKFSIPNDKAMKAAKVSEKYKDLPAGKYIVRTWHERLKTVTKEITVAEEGEVQVELSLRRGKPSKELYPKKKQSD